MSALPLKADMRDAKTDVCFGPEVVDLRTYFPADLAAVLFIRRGYTLRLLVACDAASFAITCRLPIDLSEAMAGS